MKRAYCEHITQIINKNYLYFEKGYSEALGHEDNEYESRNFMFVSREEAISKDYLI